MEDGEGVPAGEEGTGQGAAAAAIQVSDYERRRRRRRQAADGPGPDGDAERVGEVLEAGQLARDPRHHDLSNIDPPRLFHLEEFICLLFCLFV